MMRVDGSELGGGTSALIESGSCAVWFCSGPGNTRKEVAVDLGRQEASDGALMRIVRAWPVVEVAVIVTG